MSYDPKKASFTDRVIDRINEALTHKHAIPVLALAVFVDSFVFFIPTDGLLVATVFANRKRWVAIALAVVFGSLIGSLCLAAGIEYLGPTVLETVVPGLQSSSGWLRSVELIDRYGNVAILLTAMSPLSQQPAVALAALAQTPLWEIGAWLLGGRLVKYLLLAWIAQKSPQMISKIPFVRSEVSHVKHED